MPNVLTLNTTMNGDVLPPLTRLTLPTISHNGPLSQKHTASLRTAPADLTSQSAVVGTPHRPV